MDAEAKIRMGVHHKRAGPDRCLKKQPWGTQKIDPRAWAESCEKLIQGARAREAPNRVTQSSRSSFSEAKRISFRTCRSTGTTTQIDQECTEGGGLLGCGTTCCITHPDTLLPSHTLSRHTRRCQWMLGTMVHMHSMHIRYTHSHANMYTCTSPSTPLPNKHSHTHIHTHAYTRTRKHARARARAHARTHARTHHQPTDAPVR